MLPAINPSVLERNPRFKLLYQDLTNSRLNPDGSSRLIKQQRAQADAEKALQLLRKESAQGNIVQRGIETLADAGDLPEDILQACRVAVAVLRDEIGSADREVLEADMDIFRSNLSRMSSPIASKLEQEVKLLNEMALAGVESLSPDGAQLSVSKHQAPSKQLPSNALVLLNMLSTQASTIASTRARIADLMEALSITNREALESGVRVLEQTVHGSVARAAKARAENAGVVAKGLELKIKILARTDPVLNEPQLVSALKSYAEHLASTENELLAKVAKLEKELGAYQEQGTAMTQITSRYSELLKKKSDLNSEIKRLEQGS